MKHERMDLVRSFQDRHCPNRSRGPPLKPTAATQYVIDVEKDESAAPQLKPHKVQATQRKNPYSPPVTQGNQDEGSQK